MPIRYNPVRAYQPARIADVHAELVQEVARRRREARQNRINAGRVAPATDMEVEYLDDDSEYNVEYRPGYGTVGTLSYTEL